MVKLSEISVYEQLYAQYYLPLRNIAAAMIGDVMEAEDLVQTLFIDIWQKRLLMTIHSSMDAYMRKAVYHRSLNLMEKKRKIKLKHHAYTYILQSHNVKDLYEVQDREDKLYAMMPTLSSRRMEVLKWVYMENKKYKEVAALMGISVNSVKTHLKLAIKILREHFEKTV